MKNDRIVFITILLLAVFVVFPTYAKDASDLETIIEGANIGDMLVTSGKGNLVFEYTRIDSLSKKAIGIDKEFLLKALPGTKVVTNNHEYIEIFYAFDGKKIRCNENSHNLLPPGVRYTRNWQWTYNGEKMDLLRLDGLGHNDLVKPMGSTRTDNDIPVNRYDPRYNGLNISGTPVSSFLRGSFDGKKISDLRIIGEEIQDDLLCKVIRGQTETGDIITVWLAPRLMYRPKHIEIRSSYNEITVIHNTFKELNKSWFPQKITKEEYYSDDNTGKKVLYTRETILIQSDFEINIALSNSLFEAKFPRGLTVYDYRTGERFEIDK